MFPLISSDKITYEYFLQDNICRLCWNPNAINPATENEFMDKVLECIGINLFGSVLIPNKICTSCFVNVEHFHKFKICSHKADQKLRNIIEKQNLNVEFNYKSELETDDENKEATHTDAIEPKVEDHDTDPINDDSHLEPKVEDHDADSINDDVHLAHIPEKRVKNIETKTIKLGFRKSETYCNICHIDFRKKEKYVSHIAEGHGIIDNGTTILYQCFGCDKTFSQRRTRLAHEKTLCEALKDGYGCRICNKFQPNRKTYEAHVRSHRLHNTATLPNILQFECRHCNESFESKQELNEHITQHSVEKKKYVCEHCGRVFTRHDYLHKHKLLHTGTKKHVCTYCGFRATQKSSLNVHIRRHTGERPFSCDICQQKCVSSSNLKAHRKRHLGLKDYQCALCDKKFGYKVSLEEHIAAIHERTQEFKCEHCSAIYTRKRGLKRHVLTKHKKVDNNDGKQQTET